MIRSKLLRSALLLPALLLLMGVATPILPGEPLSAAPPPAQGVHITPIGKPTWQPVDFHLYSGPFGTIADGNLEYYETFGVILPPPKHVPNPALGIGPGIAHLPPYDTEIATGVANLLAILGEQEAVKFTTSDFSNGRGVQMAWMNIPNPGTIGSSPDFVAGPIIPNTLFPIHVSGVTIHDGKVFDPVLVDYFVPKLDASIGFPGLDGHSHFPVFLGENAEYGPANAKLRGSYDFEIDMVDTTGNGWRVEVHFTVVP